MWLDIHDINNGCCQCHTSSPLTVTGAANNDNNGCAQASLLSKVSKTVKYSLTYWLITHPAPYRFRQCGSSCHIATAISTTLMTPSNVFWPPTTPIHASQPFSNPFWPPTTLRHASWPPQQPVLTTYNPQTHVSNIRHVSQPFSNLFQPPTTLRHMSRPLRPQQPVSTTYNHLDPSYNPQTRVSSPRHASQPLSNPFWCP